MIHHHLPTRVLSIIRSQSRLPASRLPFLVFSLHRILSAAASIPSKPFSVEDYLVANCGLTRAQALRASRKLSHLKSPSKPDAVLAFLSGLGVPRPDIAAVVVADPRILFASVGRTLAPRFTELSNLGLSPPQIARVLSIRRTSSLRGNLLFWLAVFGSYDKLLPLAKLNSNLLSINLEKVAKPNLTFLRQCGISACDIARINLYSCRLFTVNPKFLQDAVTRVEELGVERGSPMFRRALGVRRGAGLTDVPPCARCSRFHEQGECRQEITAVREVWVFTGQCVGNGLLEKFGFSQDNVLVIVRKAPHVLGLSDRKIRRAVEFLMRDVGLKAMYIAQRPVLIMYSLERRLLLRHCLLKVLRAKGLLNVELDYYATASLAEKKFVQKFVEPYKDHVPGLADDYTSRCSGNALNRVACCGD